MIFLASPYRDPDPTVRLWRYEQAVLFCCAHIMTDIKCRPIYSPIVHWHPVAELNPLLHKKDTEFWMDLNRPWLEICDELWVLGLAGWRKSEGIATEIERVKSYGRVVLLCLPTEKHGLVWERIA